jgi:hypothetical protein
MAQFADAAHAASWAGLCPGNSESAGKRKSGATRKGNRYLRRILVQSAWAAMRKKDCFLSALFFRVAQRRGMKKAALAVAHRILVFAYHIIRDGNSYREAGGDYFDKLNPERTVARLTKRLENIGYQVQVTPSATAPAVAAPVAPPAAPRGAGRPCKCAVRGVPCSHIVPPPKPAPPKPMCAKCASWGIPCIHVRNAKLSAPPATNSTESAS